MRLGAALPLTDQPIGESAQLLESIGYASIWTFDAVGRGRMLPDPLMALAAAATATESIELGTGVMQLPIRNTAELAHRMFTLRQIAGDRLVLGVGPGSTEADFLTFGADYSDRFKRFEEQWTELKQWLATGSHGERKLSPWPNTVGEVQLALAGWHGRWVERAAAEGVAWIASGAKVDFATVKDALARFRAAGGTRAVVTNVRVTDDVPEAIGRVEQLATIGFDDVIVFDLAPTVDRLHAVFDACADVRAS